MRGYLYRRGRIWWMKYYVDSRPRRESTGTDKEKQACRLLADRAGRIARGEGVLPRLDRVTYDEAAADLRKHYQATRSRDLREVGKRLKHLDLFFTAVGEHRARRRHGVRARAPGRGGGQRDDQP